MNSWKTIFCALALLVLLLILPGCTSPPSPGTAPTPSGAVSCYADSAPSFPPSTRKASAKDTENYSQYGYKGGVPFGEIKFARPNSTDNPLPSMPGSWRIYSSRLFYDIGGAGASEGAGSSRTLELDSSCHWTYGSSSGTWLVAPISQDDWKSWGVESYGPKYKLVLNNWNKAGADGPIEVTGTSAVFTWVIYHIEPPLVEYAGQVQTKFGH